MSADDGAGRGHSRRRRLRHRLQAAAARCDDAAASAKDEDTPGQDDYGKAIAGARRSSISQATKLFENAAV